MSTLRIEGRQNQKELANIHDFASKLLQPSLLPKLKEYVIWQHNIRAATKAGKSLDELLLDSRPSPVSINLDLTTACNYRCDHCVDMDILNTGVRFDHDRLKESLRLMSERGLRSVIVIGGGEPTVYPKFEEMIIFMKNLGLSLGIVTNGSMMHKIDAVAEYFEKGDWVRLSLDSGSDEVFQAMHKPRREVTLDEICAAVPAIRKKNPDLDLGFSFIIVWDDCEANDSEIHENLKEIEMAAERANKYDFSYISFKPFLTRSERNNAEIVDLAKDGQDKTRVDPIMAEIRARINRAKRFQNSRFRVIESTNLKVFENGTYRNYTEQPKNCHMQFFRQVMSPLGLFNCPVYRHVDQAQISDKHAYSDEAKYDEAHLNTLKIIQEFDASSECKQVTCLYNHVNWFIEELINKPEKLNELVPVADRKDYFF